VASGQLADYGPGVDAMVSPAGHRVEQVLVQRSLSGPPKPYLRGRHGTYFAQDCTTVEEVAQLVDLASLVPEHKRGVRHPPPYPHKG
jgi:hypothetical protein